MEIGFEPVRVNLLIEGESLKIKREDPDLKQLVYFDQKRNQR
jgi:hypothetical protein